MTPSRDFLDESGRLWTAWDVIPSWGERRRHDRRAGGNASPPGIIDRRRANRRRRPGIRVGLPPELANGWLAFISGVERRRVAPIPPQWDALSEEQLLTLWQDAERLPDRRRRLVE